MAGETIITVVGNLTRDPELRTVGNGSTVVNFTIASSTRTFNRNTNQWEDGDTLFLNCSAWDSQHTALASNIAHSLSKGMNVIAQGRLVQRTYETENHEKRTVVELRVDTIGPSLRRATAQVNRQSASAGFVGSQQGGQSAAGSGAPYQGGATRSASSAVSDPWADGDGGFGTTFGARDDSDDF
ncbi:single-stranded DNA-binding protein [Bifidobacterium castoris]|uniref:Single-stranded DNA-binding protein n=1 Tax=Bifidobacterium castoris TaxID=2306972 RepID=A0A430F589_9BIFI|nr:single-stranded DNA-binding protein [Bifidobacterium castoris]RSX46094.1 single-stranded DNA-binding protein [Bifidobacterium castoris]